MNTSQATLRSSWLWGLTLLTACGAAEEAGSCVTVADTAAALVGPGEEYNGVRLQGMNMQGTSFNGTSFNGTAQTVYRGLEDLAGAHLALATGAPVVLRDGQLSADGYPRTASLRGVELTGTTADGRRFGLEVRDVASADETELAELFVADQPVCERGDHGLFVAGRWDAQGEHLADADTVTYSCMSGVIAKCVRWGYSPWDTDVLVHDTCTRMARADYCGDGHSWTVDGTLIDIYDRLGVQTPLGEPDMIFEAAWGPHGAVCVNHTRYDVRDEDGQSLQPPCLRSLPACDSFEAPQSRAGLIANSSRQERIHPCN